MRILFSVAAILGHALGLSAAQQSSPADRVSARFLSAAPQVDGVLDSNLADLPITTLTPMREAASGPRMPGLRVAYGADFLYVFAEVDAERFVTRDRAYQNGDGLLVVVTKPRPDGEPSDEFYVLGFSAGRPAARWQERFVWYRNKGLEMMPLDQVRLATASANGRSAFEVLIPWSEVYPLHPWLTEQVGLNACVTQALPDEKSIRSCLVPDNRVDSEQSPRRSRPVSFDPPVAAQDDRVAAILDRNHIVRGATTNVRLAVLASAARQLPVVVRCISGEGTRLFQRQVELSVPAGLSRHDVEIGVEGLAPGGYMVTWEAGASRGQSGLTVLAADDVAALGKRLDAVQKRLSAGSVHTLRFQIGEIERQLSSLKPTDTAAAVRVAVDDVMASLAAAESGTDRTATRIGLHRRAYRSSVDQSLQPYSIRIPEGYRPDRRYPLIVWLHGSGQDDRDQLTRRWLPTDCILVAPRGRGPSTWYTIDHAQDDLREAVDDVMKHYSVDANRVVLAGFSMGGYGVYRTAMQDPKRFRALAVFSGSPRARGVSTDLAPDYLAVQDISPLTRVPVFVFHGGRDRNCPIEETRAFIDRLKGGGADVTFAFEAEKGHETPGADSLGIFTQWFQRVIGVNEGR